MTVEVNSQGIIGLSGQCGARDAEVLQQHLLVAPGSAVEWTACEYLHSAVIQVLLAGAARMQGTPKAAFLATHIAPILARPGK